MKQIKFKSEQVILHKQKLNKLDLFFLILSYYAVLLPRMRNKKQDTLKLISFITALLFINSLVNAQNYDSCKFELKGQILDADTKEGLPYVQIKVGGTQQISSTDIEGKFHIENLCNELNTLHISCFGYCDTICKHYHQHEKVSHIYLNEQVHALETVTISVESRREKGTFSIAQESIKKEALSANPTQTLAAAISEINGVTFTSTGNNVQLPVIHGLYGNRILILNNGLKHGFQNWGTDHAPEINILSANKVTVIKGAAGVRYGPEALGGAVVVEADPLYLNEPLKGNLGTGYQTNGKGYFVKSEIGQGHKKWSYNIGANYTKIGDKNTPKYSLTNSGKEETSINSGVRYNNKGLDVKIYYSYVNQNLALLRTSIAESGDAFVKAINSKTPTFIRPFSYTINEPNQLTKHHLGKAEVNWWYSDHSKITFRYGKQLNKREEYDVRRSAEKPIINLDLTTNDYQLEWKHPDWLELDGLIGVQGFTQDNDNIPGTGTTPFIPNYNTLRYSGFIFESLKIGTNTFEVGMRLDHEYNNIRGRTTRQEIFRDDYSFTNLTSSLGYVKYFSDNVTLRTNIGTAWRTPNMAELFSYGQHGFKTSFGLLRYDTDENGKLKTDKVKTIDNSTVSPEKGYKWINEINITKKYNTYKLTLFSHYIENYIFDRPIAVIGTIRGPMPVFIFEQANAFFIGTDVTWQKNWSTQLSSTYGISYLWSKNIKRNQPLFNQPPITTNFKLIWEMKKTWKFETSTFSIQPSYTFTQFQAPRTVTPTELIEGIVTVTPESEIFDFNDATNGYFLCDLSWNFGFKNLRGAITIKNIFNTSYRNYLNEMKYFADEPGRNFLFTINYMFNTKSKQK